MTTILGVIAKPALVTWANRMGLQGIDTTRHVDDLAQSGTLAHGLIQEHLTGQKVDQSEFTHVQIDRAENAVLSYFEWEKHQHMETILAETPLVSEELHFGGTPDWYGKLGARRVLLDFKTSKGIWPDHLYQLAGYAYLLTEAGHHIDEARILRIGREPEEGFEERVVSGEAIPKYLAVFEAALELYKAVRRAK